MDTLGKDEQTEPKPKYSINNASWGLLHFTVIVNDVFHKGGKWM